MDNMKAIIEGFAGKADQAAQRPGEYLGEDGLLHCGICGKAVQFRMVLKELGIERTVRCRCGCKSEVEKFEERMQHEELMRQKRRCFEETNMYTWTFENDDRKYPKLSDAMQNYANNFKEFRKSGQGLLLYGPVGTGKTYFAACIANRVIESGYTAKMTNFTRLINQIMDKKDDKQMFIDELNHKSLLVIDDLGTERGTEFMQEQVYNIIDARYRSGLPFIVTTNLTAETLKRPENVGQARIYDRILERCFPVEVKGPSRRRAALKESYVDVKTILGL